SNSQGGVCGVRRPLYVDGVGSVDRRVAVGCSGRQMVNELTALGRSLHRLSVANIAADDFNATCFKPGRICFRSNQSLDAVSLTEQAFDEVAANKTRGARNQHIHPKTLLL